MPPLADLEERLRKGLREAAETIPPAPERPVLPATGRRWNWARRSPTAPPRRSWAWLAPAWAAAAALLVVVAVVAVNRRDDRSDEVEAADPPQEDASTTSSTAATTPPTTAPYVAAPANGMTPGRAVIRDDGTIRLYGDDGTETGAVTLVPGSVLADSASSDLAGGWVICDGSGLVWLRAEGQASTLGPGARCGANGVRVVDAAAGPTAVYPATSIVNDARVTSFRRVVLATGVDTLLELPLRPELTYSWSAATDRFVLWSEETGLQLFDISAGTPQLIATPGLNLAVGADLALSPDGRTLATLSGDVAGAVQVRIHDLASGEVIFSAEATIGTEGAGLSFDGTVIAFGSYYADRGPVEVIDTTTGASYTIDTHGVLL